MVRPVPVHPATDSKNAERGSIPTFIPYSDMKRNGMAPINERRSQPSDAVLIACFGAVSPAFLHRK